MTTENVFEFFLSSTSEQSIPSLPFERLTNESIARANSQSNEIDVDYFCFTDKCTNLFVVNVENDRNADGYDESRKPIDQLIRNNMPKFYKECYFQSLYSNFLEGVRVIAECGSWKIGRPIYKNSQNVQTQENDEDEEAAFCFEMSREQIIKDVNRILVSLPTSNIPYEDFKVEILKSFVDQEFCVFCFGQKQRLQNVARNIADFAATDGKLEIALGTEFDFGEKFVTTEYAKEYAHHQYSNFLSNISCNTEITNKESCRQKFETSYRICAYNTLQHDKKHLNFFLKKSSTQAMTNETTYGTFHDSVVANLLQLNRIPEFIDRSFFRFEVYFTISDPREFGHAKTLIKKIPGWLQLVSIPKETLKMYITSCAQNLLDLAELSKIQENCGSYFFFLYLYGLFVAGLQSTERMTLKFLEWNYGLNIPSCHYNVNSMHFHSDFFCKNAGPKLWNMLLNIFGKSNSSFDEKLYFALAFYWESPFFLTAELSMHFVTKVKRFFLIHAQKCRANQDHNREFVAPSKFFYVFKKKHSSNFLINSIVNMITRFSDRNDNCYANICSSLTDSRAYFIYDRAFYYVKGPSENDHFVVISIENISLFVKKHRFNNVAEMFDENYNGVTDVIEIRSFLERLNLTFGIFFKAFIKSENISMPIRTTESEFFLRLIFAKIPSQENGLENDDMVDIVDLFKTIKDFFSFVSYALLMAFSNQNFGARQRKQRDKLIRNLLKTKNGTLWTPCKLLYVTGLFGCFNHYACDREIILPIPKKVFLGELLKKTERKRLLGQVGPNVLRTSADSLSKLAKYYDGARRYVTSNELYLNNFTSANDFRQNIIESNTSTLNREYFSDELEASQGRSRETSFPSLQQLPLQHSNIAGQFMEPSNNSIATELFNARTIRLTVAETTEPPDVTFDDETIRESTFHARTNSSITSQSASSYDFENEEVAEILTENVSTLPIAPISREEETSILNSNTTQFSNDEEIDRIIRTNVVLRNFQIALREMNFERNDFLNENKIDTKDILIGVLQMKESQAEKIFRIFQRELHII